MRNFINWMKRNEHRYNVIHDVDNLLQYWRDMDDHGSLVEAIELLQGEL